MSAFSAGILCTANHPWICLCNTEEGKNFVTTQTLPERIVILDQYRNQWIVDQDDKIWPKVLELHQAGNDPIVLPLAYITENRSWGWWTAFEKQITWLSEALDNRLENNQHMLKGLDEAPLEDLARAMQEYGSFLGYLEAQVGVLLGRHIALKEGYESGINVAMWKIGKDAGNTVKEREGAILATNSLLRQTRYQMIEIEVLLETARKHRDAYKIFWDSVSRIISIRLGEMNFAAKDRQP